MSLNFLKKFVGLWRQWVAVLLLITMVPIISGCYGNFSLTKAVYRYNADVTYHKVLRSLLFWGLVIIPVYGFAVLGDAIVFNLIEFWTGTRLNVNLEKENEDSRITLTPFDDGNGAVLKVTQDNKIISQLRFVKISDSAFEVYDENNQLSGMVIQTPEGDLKFTDKKGKPIHTIQADEIQVLSRL